MNMLRAILSLGRARIALFASASAATGYLLGPHGTHAGALIPAGGVFFMACGASALNQWQERRTDALMDRTRDRVLPRGGATPRTVLGLALLLVAVGLAVPAASGSWTAVWLSLFALAWYNGVYTLLKRASVHAVILGGVVGMVPPAIGWASAGNHLLDPRIAVLSSLLLLWQVPHFLLLLLVHGNDYQRAGLAVITSLLRSHQVARAAFSWIAASSVLICMMPLFGIGSTPAYAAVFGVLAAWSAWRSRALFSGSPELHAPGLFRMMNRHMLLVLAILSWHGTRIPLP